MNAIKQGYKQTKVGIIPEDWEVVRLGEVVEVLTDYHANGSYEILKDNVELLESEEYAVMVRTTNFEQNNFDNNLIYINEHSYNFLKKSKVYFGDIIINKIANAGATYFMPKINKPVSLGMNLFLLRIKNKYSKFFIYYQIKKREVFLKALASGTSTLTITKDDVRNFRIPTPFFKEQEKIAEILATWDEAISLHVKLIGEKEQLKIGLMQKLLSGEVRFEGFCDEWENISLNTLFDFKKGQELSKEKLDENGIFECILYGELYTTYSEVIKNVQSKTNIQEGIKSKIDDILIPASTTTSAIDLAIASTIQKNDVLLGGDINILRKKKNNINGEFIAKYLTHIKKIEIAKYAQGITIIHLYTKDFKHLKIKLPSLLEQQKIAEVLSLADDELNLLKKELEELKQQKKGLMQKLLTGEVRVIY